MSHYTWANLSNKSKGGVWINLHQQHRRHHRDHSHNRHHRHHHAHHHRHPRHRRPPAHHRHHHHRNHRHRYPGSRKQRLHRPSKNIDLCKTLCLCKTQFLCKTVLCVKDGFDAKKTWCCSNRGLTLNQSMCVNHGFAKGHNYIERCKRRSAQKPVDQVWYSPWFARGCPKGLPGLVLVHLPPNIQKYHQKSSKIIIIVIFNGPDRILYPAPDTHKMVVSTWFKGKMVVNRRFLGYMPHFQGKKSSDPHPETLFWHSFWMFLTYHLEVYMAYSFWHATVIYCIYCIWHLFWHTFWHLFWHSFWHSIWRLFWHSIWHLFRHSFWHLYRHSDSLWHSFWHSIISGIYSYIFSVAFYLTFSLASGGGPAVPTEIWRSRLRSGSAHSDFEHAL